MIRRMLQCLDENKPVEAINLKDAVFMMAKAWDDVSITTISNCWNKAGFPDDIAEPSHDPFESDEEEETDESGGSLWGNITHHCPALAEISFSDFVSLDNNVVTECQPTEQEATREALQAVQSVDSANHEKDDDEDDLDDDISVLEPEPLSPSEATKAVRALRNFVMTFDKSGAREREFLRSLSSMEDTFLRMQTRRQKANLEKFKSSKWLQNDFRTTHLPQRLQKITQARSKGLTFGDFTAEEWEKYFSNSVAQTGHLPAVEFLFDFDQYSDHEEPGSNCRADDSRVQIPSSDSSAATKNVGIGLEDSGVEVGQESEQENAPGKAVAVVLVHELINKTPKGDKESTEPPRRSTTEHIVFGGKSIQEPESETKNKSESPPTTTTPDVDSFPPLLSTVNSHAERDKPENERLRKRRKRRKQRKRSGSVSSSSSECSEKERSPGNLTGSSIKGKTAASLLTTDKVIVSKVDNDAGKVHVNVLCSSPKEQKDSNSHSTDKKTTSQRKSKSSWDGETIGDRKSSSSTDGTSNSPVQSDTDVKITVTANTAEQPLSSGRTNEFLELENQSPSITDEGKHSNNAAHEGSSKKELPKPSSWADLFKSSAKASPGIVVKVTSPVIRTETNSTSAGKKTEDPVQTTVGVEEDKYAKELAEIIQKQELNHNQKPYILRGLINRGNWCYINATLQALVGCPPFFNLLRQLPYIKERGPTSTPILDSLVVFMNEFKELQVKPGNSPAPSKVDFTTGEPFEPSNVYKMLLIIQSSLSTKGRQEDAQEFLSCILNGMHEEMLQLTQMISGPVKAQEKDADLALTTDDLTADDELTPEGQEDDGDWEQVGPKNKSMVTRMASYPQSLISDIFGGFLRSSVHQTGLKDSANVEPFFELQLDVQTVTSVEEALKNLVLKEELQGYTCTKTKLQVDVSRRVTLEGLPKVLILHLKRFIYSKNGSQKLTKVIDYPLELTIGKELLSPNVKNKYSAAQKTYKLFAVVYHHGKNACGGHYTSDVCHATHGWIRADDTRLKVVPFNYVLKPTQGKDPYMLFYRRIDLMP